MSGEIHHIGAGLKLLCPQRHHIGYLRQRSFVPTETDYWPKDGAKTPWPPSDKSGPADRWTVPCPEGCPGQFGGVVDDIRRAVKELGDDPTRDEGEYTLQQA